ncbi:MAG: hypothetical protein ABWX76_15340, partial [Leifsonia flava]
LIREAAPGHVTFVREAVFDPLSPEEQDVLARALDRIRGRISENGLWGGQKQDQVCPPETD